MSEEFTTQARKLWEKVPTWAQEKILSNVWCSEYRGSVIMIDFRGNVEGGDLVLRGACKNCSSPVVRVVESN